MNVHESAVLNGGVDGGLIVEQLLRKLADKRLLCLVLVDKGLELFVRAGPTFRTRLFGGKRHGRSVRMPEMVLCHKVRVFNVFLT